MRKFLSKISYSILPFFIFVVVLLVSYFGNQLLTNFATEGSLHYGTTWAYTPLDDKIPLISAFIYVYYLTFPVGIVTFFYLAFTNKRKFFDLFVTLCISFLISSVIYFFFQTRFVKPDFTPVTFTDKLVVWTWNSTNPTNCFPSQHCFMAIAIFLACADCKEMKIWYRIFGCVLGILIVLSTVFTRQHYWVDFLGSLVIMLPIWLVAKKFLWGEKIGQKFDNLYAKMRRKKNANSENGQDS